MPRIDNSHFMISLLNRRVKNMSCHTADGRNRLQRWFAGGTALLAVATMVIGAAQVRAAGLTFVPALDDTAGASQNIFPAAGGALSTVLDNTQSTAGDGKWGFVAAGANADIYESST